MCVSVSVSVYMRVFASERVCVQAYVRVSVRVWARGHMLTLLYPCDTQRACACVCLSMCVC